MSSPCGQAAPPGERSLRVALLHYCYWPEVRRGTERFLHELAAGLVADGHRPTLITSHPGPPSRTFEDGLEVVRHWRPPEGRLRRRGYQHHLSHLPLTYLSLARGGYDLAHALYPTDALAAVRWSRRHGRPAVVTFMGLPDRASLVSVRGRTETIRKVAAEAAASVSLSDAAAAAFRRELGISTRVIELGVDLERFRPGDARADTPTIFCPAPWEDPRKRVGVLVEAFARVRARRPDAQLVLVRARARGQGRQPTAPGIRVEDVFDDTDALARAYRSAWVTVLPSVAEAFGMVLVESLACGTPIVSSDDGHPSALLRGLPEIGRLAAPDDPRSLAEALESALELAPDPRTPERCRARAQDFPIARCVTANLELYRQVLAPDGRGPDPGPGVGAG